MMREWLARVATTVVMLAMAAPIPTGQSDSTLLRTVRGRVLDVQGRALPSSVVYLYQQKTQAVRTQIADGNGLYRFSGLNPHTDYEIHAEHGDWTSSAHRLSAADGKRDVVLDLKVDKRKTHTLSLTDSRAMKTMLVLLADGMAERPVAKYEPRNTLPPG